MKLTRADIEACFWRVLLGASVNSVAHDFNVTEGALRWRFKREGWDAGAVRRAADVLIAARRLYERLSASDRRAVDRLVSQRLSNDQDKASTPTDLENRA